MAITYQCDLCGELLDSNSQCYGTVKIKEYQIGYQIKLETKAPVSPGEDSAFCDQCFKKVLKEISKKHAE